MGMSNMRHKLSLLALWLHSLTNQVPGFVRIVISINKTVLRCIRELDGTPGSAGPFPVT